MNTLSFRTTEGHRGLSIELLIDGQSLAGVVGFEDTLLPYYLFEEGDLPLGSWGVDDPRIRCVAVCICGTIGCGNAECRVVREGDVVVFRDFSGCVNPKYEREGKDGREFRITAMNYDAVLAGILKEVADYQGRI